MTMFGGMREALRAPLARPPGRRNLFVRLGPAWWAAAVYVSFLGAFLWKIFQVRGLNIPALLDRMRYSPAISGVLLGWPLAGGIALVGAVLGGAMALAPEHSRGTMDALILTPTDHERLARGRYWHGLAPLLRFFAYLLPIYIILSGSQFFLEAARELERDPMGEDFWLISAVCSFSGRPVFSYLTGWEGWLHEGPGWSVWSAVLLCLRMANDLSVLVLAYSAAYYISARSRSSGQALALACSLGPLILLTAFSLHDWMVVVILLVEKYGGGFGSRAELAITWVYCLLAAGTFAARWIFAWRLHRSACRNFERWATRGG